MLKNFLCADSFITGMLIVDGLLFVAESDSVKYAYLSVLSFSDKIDGMFSAEPVHIFGNVSGELLRRS